MFARISTLPLIKTVLFIIFLKDQIENSVQIHIIRILFTIVLKIISNNIFTVTVNSSILIHLLYKY